MKNKVTSTAFIDWYFSDNSDIDIIGQRIINDLMTDGKVTLTARQLFDECGYIPQYICENPNGDDEYEPSEIEFIQE